MNLPVESTERKVFDVLGYGQATWNISPFVEGINPEIDLATVASEFQQIWAQHPAVPYENYIHGHARGMDEKLVFPEAD